jgi:hypothetical protein
MVAIVVFQVMTDMYIGCDEDYATLAMLEKRCFYPLGHAHVCSCA